LSPEQAIYIGDSYERDYKGAKSVGMDCLVIGRHARVPRDSQLLNILDLAINFETGRK
jgi:FMN phosphatase YigB (HAD superfamily)